MLLSALALRVNRVLFTTGDNLDDAKYKILALSQANSTLELIKNKKFDEKTVGGSVSSSGELSTVMGKETGETDESLFDDIDDYNNYLDTLKDMSFTTIDEIVKCKVSYFNPTNPAVPASSPTFHKKITVVVKNKFMRDSVSLSTVFSYWAF